MDMNVPQRTIFMTGLSFTICVNETKGERPKFHEFHAVTASSPMDGHISHAVLNSIPTGALDILKAEIEREMAFRAHVRQIILNPLFQ